MQKLFPAASAAKTTFPKHAKTKHRDMQRLSTAAATAQTTLPKHAANKIQVIRTRIPHTRRQAQKRHMEIALQDPKVFPGGPPPQY